MIEDLRSGSGTPHREVDICLIGAGAAGITIAREFISSGLRVCLVESGGFEFEEDTQRLYVGDSVGMPLSGLELGRLRFFGGTTNHWGGRCTRLNELDFARRDWVPHSGWPITLADLEPYYRRARDLCGLGPERPVEAVLSELDINLPELSAKRLHSKIWQYTPSNWSFGVVYRDELRRADNIFVLLHANLTSITTDAMASVVTSVTATALNRATCSIKARYYVLCCGAIENARLLLLTADGEVPALGNRHDIVGRFYMDHTRGQMGLLATDDALPKIEEMFNFFYAPNGTQYEIGLEISPAAQGERQLLSCSATLQYEGDPTSGITEGQAIWRELQHGRWPEDIGAKVWRVVRDFDVVARDVRRRVLAGRHPLLPLRSATVTVEMEQAPNPESRITLSSEKDALGLQKVRVCWQLTDLERRTAEQFTTMVAAELTRLQLGRCRLAPWLAPPTGDWALNLSEMFHQTGTTRMAADPRQGVVDETCKVHGVQNLYVAGASVFPSGGHANPTFTIVALALRLSDHLKAAPR
jgi:choline dehydrogenase-like flavoprotein